MITKLAKLKLTKLAKFSTWASGLPYLSHCTPLHGILYFLPITNYFLSFLCCTYFFSETYATSIKTVERILQKFLKFLVGQWGKFWYLKRVNTIFIILRVHHFHKINKLRKGKHKHKSMVNSLWKKTAQHVIYTRLVETLLKLVLICGQQQGYWGSLNYCVPKDWGQTVKQMHNKC